MAIMCFFVHHRSIQFTFTHREYQKRVKILIVNHLQSRCFEKKRRRSKTFLMYTHHTVSNGKHIFCKAKTNETSLFVFFLLGYILQQITTRFDSHQSSTQNCFFFYIMSLKSSIVATIFKLINVEVIYTSSFFFLRFQFNEWISVWDDVMIKWIFDLNESTKWRRWKSNE